MISKLKDDLKVTFLLSCFVGHPVVQSTRNTTTVQYTGVHRPISIKKLIIKLVGKQFDIKISISFLIPQFYESTKDDFFSTRYQSMNYCFNRSI